MNTENLVFLFLVSYSLTFGWIESPLFTKIKSLKFFEHPITKYLTFCYHCCGFWISFLVSLVYYRKFLLSLQIALCFSIIMVWLNSLLVLLQSMIKKEEK